jgi:hypothetical protein
MKVRPVTARRHASDGSSHSMAHAEMPGIGHLMTLKHRKHLDALLLEFLREPRPESSVRPH